MTSSQGKGKKINCSLHKSQLSDLRMNSTTSLLVTLLFISSSSSSSISALVIRIPSGKVKCVTEDIAGPASSSISVATYRLLPAGDYGGAPHHHNLSARVSDPKGDTIHLAENVDSGEFAFTAEVPGQYSACFWSPVFRYGGQIEVDFEWKTGIAAGRFGGVAKRGKISAVETELKKLEDTVNSIYMEMKILRHREEESWKINDDINFRMGILSLLSLVICFGVAGFQIWHMKTFFVREKIL